MLMIISPAKTLDFKTPSTTQAYSTPLFLKHAEALIELARKLSVADICALMKISEKLGILNYERFHDWHTPFTTDNAKQAILAFQGDVYTGLDAKTLDNSGLRWADQHLGILSGLYGLLRPLDLMQAYRLEMGIKFDNPHGKNLYDFWGSKITEALNHRLEQDHYPTLVNLASNEYFKVLQPQSIAARIIKPVFQDEKNGRFKVVAFYAKKARGLMARWIIDNRLDKRDDLQDFNVAGYYFAQSESDANTLVFKRPEAH